MTAFGFLSFFVVTSFLQLLLLTTIRYSEAQSFAAQLNKNAQLHPQKNVKPGPVLPDGDSYGDSRALNVFRPGASNSQDAAHESNAYGSIAPFGGRSSDAAPSVTKHSPKSVDADDIRAPARFGSFDAAAFKKSLVRKTRAAHSDAYAKADVHENEFGPKFAKCSFVDNVIHSNAGKISGVVLLQQAKAESPIRISGTIHGLHAGVHGFHLNEFGDIADFCFGIGRHYNPFNTTHGAPYDKNRHVGDLGNIIANAKGVAQVNMTDKIITLFGRYSVVGRALSIHAIADDLGRGDDPLSKVNGNPGPHVACCTIGVAMDGTLAEKPSKRGRPGPDSFGFA